MIHQPPDPFAAPRGVVDYVRRVAEAGDGLPLVLYLRNDAMGTAAIADLCAVEGVVAVKWATPNPMRMAEAAAAADPGVIWVAGLAETWAPVLYAAGARGFTSGLINVWPERSMAIHSALAAGDYVRANALITPMRAFEDIRAEDWSLLKTRETPGQCGQASHLAVGGASRFRTVSVYHELEQGVEWQPNMIMFHREDSSTSDAVTGINRPLLYRYTSEKPKSRPYRVVIDWRIERELCPAIPAGRTIRFLGGPSMVEGERGEVWRLRNLRRAVGSETLNHEMGL